ncbi:MAG: 4Fe-4S binding protein [Oscillospiraceae bacterium]|nr:4Fe-4S binding protein [Oscillospiraceae bacterium]
MIRQIIKIEEEKCNGCGLCANACHEGAIEIVNGKAKLIRDDYCDGLGNCLPACPTGAISFEEREALEYNEKLVEENKKAKDNLPCGCPGTHARMINKNEIVKEEEPKVENTISELNQWPVQIKLVPINAPYFENADLLIAADCTAYAYANFHSKFMKNKITIIGCPKLDEVDYSEKLTEILKNNNINSITVLKMEVPCCNGILAATKEALRRSDKIIPWQVHTISIDGRED